MVLYQKQSAISHLKLMSYPMIASLLSEDSKQVFYYRHNLWQYLKDNHGLACGQSIFRTYIANTPELKSYFEKEERLSSLHSSIRLKRVWENKHSWIGRKVFFREQVMVNRWRLRSLRFHI